MTVEPKFTRKSLSASEYVLALFEARDNVAVLLRNRTTRQTVQRITTAETTASREFQSWLRYENFAGADIYLGMNPIKDGAYNRTKANIREIRHLYLDLDKDGSQALEAIRDSTEVPPPNFLLDTSPGKYQVVWKVAGIAQDQAESLLYKIANHFGGDPAATDCARVLRLPGFMNRKYEHQFIVQVVQESDRMYGPRDFVIQQDSPETPRSFGEPREELAQGKSPSHKSQSEHDWAYAKRALARGDVPEKIIREIAEFRAGEKHDPDDYARRTVTKAQADLNHSTSSSANASPARNGISREPSH
jgi:hypothetical protein